MNPRQVRLDTASDVGRRESAEERRTQAAQLSAGIASPAINEWAAVVFVFFSASSSKLVSYILPMLPALALLVGVRLAQLGPKAIAWRNSLRLNQARLYSGSLLFAVFTLNER